MSSTPRYHRGIAGLVVGVLALGCGSSGTEPIDVRFGETTFVVVVNPVLNTVNQATVPAPGATQAGVAVNVTSGPPGSTDPAGIVVLRPVTPGTRALELSGGGAAGQLQVAIADRELRELAIALTAGGASLMANVEYAFGGQVVTVTPTMSLSRVNDELARSNIIVFFRAGTYTGDLQFSGSNVTLFGEGPSGGAVTINGAIQVSGSNNRARGVRINGALSVPGSNFGMSFSRVVGATQITGSNTTLLNNAFCGTVTISGSGTRALGNAGLAPLPQPTGGC